MIRQSPLWATSTLPQSARRPFPRPRPSSDSAPNPQTRHHFDLSRQVAAYQYLYNEQNFLFGGPSFG